MSIAFPALVITILILPGILFFYTYRRGFGPSPVVLESVQSEIVRGILCTIPINLIAIGLIDILPFPDVDFKAVVALLTDWHGEDDVEISRNISAISSNAGLILFYVFVTNTVSALAGYFCHTVVRYYRLDLRIDFLRFSNEWRYLFSGEEYVMSLLTSAATSTERAQVKKWQISSKEIKAKEAEIDLHIASVAVEQGGQVYIYRGVLDQYFFDKKGKLQKIVLLYPQRKRIDQPHTVSIVNGVEFVDDGFYQIDGHYFVIEYERVLNFNLYYYRYSESSEVGAEA